ncbi:MAG TPA: IS200/IS605 family transposase [Longimicrobium sp.]|uniref:IS200/IS605 family transposase n=1 Tax=Longimicrobium sp. TaxID=2029185 RepID=UPI002ED8D265
MRRTHTRLYVHLVWATWDRLPLITPEIRERLYAVMQHQASRLRAEVIAIGGIEDHVHVLLRFGPTVTIADLVGRMKGASSYLAEQVLGHTFKWQGAYGAYSVSRSGVDRVRAYILNQEAHHREGTTHPELEATHA